MYQPFGYAGQPQVIVIKESDLQGQKPPPWFQVKKGKKGTSKLNLVDELHRIRDVEKALKDMYKEEKKEEKKDDKPKTKTFSFGEVLGMLFLFGMPLTLLQFYMLKAVGASLGLR